MKSKRCYLRIVAYCVDISVCNVWLLYKRDFKALDDRVMSLKDIRLKVFRDTSAAKPMIQRPLRHSLAGASPSVELSAAIRGHCSQSPDRSVRFDISQFHAPMVMTKRLSCKECSCKANIVRSNVVCRVCKVDLCLNDKRNCFIKYHTRVA